MRRSMPIASNSSLNRRSSSCMLCLELRRPQNYVLRVYPSGVQKCGNRVVLFRDCRMYWFFSLFGRTLQNRCFNFLHVCACRSEFVAAPVLKNSINRIPSKSQNTLATNLWVESAPWICSPAFCLQFRFRALRRQSFWPCKMCSEDLVLRKTTSWKLAYTKCSVAPGKRFKQPA